MSEKKPDAVKQKVTIHVTFFTADPSDEVGVLANVLQVLSDAAIPFRIEVADAV